MVVVAQLHSAPEIVRHLDRYVVGQLVAKRRLAMAVYRHYLGRRCRDSAFHGGHDFGRQHQLLLGPTGVGKSLLVKTLGRLLGVPVAFTAATSLVETGYVGTPVESMFANLLERAGGDVALAERGIVLLDEFDKLKRANDVGRDVSGEGVQNGLLTLLDGRPVRLRHRDRDVQMDSSAILFLCTGAFSGLTTRVRARLGRAARGSLGFSASKASRERLGEVELLDRVTPEDLIEYGLIPELVARFSGLVTLHPLSRPELERVLGELKSSPLRVEQRLFELHGIRLVVSPGARAVLIDRALEQGLGARTLQRVVSEAFASLEYQLPRLVDDGVGEVRVSRESIEGSAPHELVSSRELPDWVVPCPSARELCARGLGAVAGPESPAPRPRPVERARPRHDPRRDGAAVGDAPTLFDDER